MEKQGGADPKERCAGGTGCARLADCVRQAADPQWLLFMLVMCLPVLYYALVRGQPVRAWFFWGVALYAGVCKWTGWLLLTRRAVHQQRFLMFPAEILSGLAFLCLWFYLRNLLGRVWPATYGLWELAALPCLITVLHLCAGALALKERMKAGRPEWTRLLWETAGPAVAYWAYGFSLLMALKSTSMGLEVPSTDPFHLAYCARSFHDHGLFFAHFNGGDPIIYTSGFGGINAVVMAIAPLSAAQATVLQHTFLTLTGVLLITCAVAALAERPLGAIHFLPLLYLSIMPIHNLATHQQLEGASRQALPGLLLGVCLVPVLAWRLGAALRAAMAASAMLAVLAAALNPSGAPFVPVIFLAALVIHCLHGKALGRRVVRTGICHVGMAVALLALMLACDEYYSRLLRRPAGRRPVPTSQEVALQPIRFSPRDGLTNLASVRPWRLETQSYPFLESEPPARTWLPGAGLCAGVGALLGWLALRRKKILPAGAAPLAFLAAGAAGVMVILKYQSAFVEGSIPIPASWDMSLLRYYQPFNLVRLESLLVFAAVLAAGVLCCLLAMRWRGRWAAAALLAGAACAAAIWLKPALPRLLDPRASGLSVIHHLSLGEITEGDLRLTAWANRNIPPEEGIIGLVCATFTVACPSGGSEKHIYPYSGAAALPLYGRELNYTFTVWDPMRRWGYDDYEAHVKHTFDAAWCLRENIRYFYITQASLGYNPGLGAAIKAGLLEPVQQLGQSSIYRVRAAPAATGTP